MIAKDFRFALFDGDDGTATLLSDYRRTLEFGGGRIESFIDSLEAVAKQGEWIALAADYELGACFEAAASQSDQARPRLRAWVYGHAQTLDVGEVAAFLESQVAKLSERERVAGVAELMPALNSENYSEKVVRIRKWIADGDCYQINLTFPLDFKVYGHPLALYARLRERQPVRYGGCIFSPDEAALSFSPELFFERKGVRIVTRPMKGTASRGSNPHEDEERGEALLASEKERAENVMIVDLLRNDLGRLAAPGKVRVDALCELEAYPSLWQMVSTVSAELPQARLSDLFRVLFPCGSITGAPKIRAMQRIAALEERPRGLYTGTLGWLAPDGCCRFNVAIRTLEITRDGSGKLGIGSGIVIDAQAQNEYAECLLKARFLTGFDPGFELVETMRLERSEYPLLSLHMQRLETSARALGFAGDWAAMRVSLEKQAADHPEGVHRVRLTLAHNGSFCIAVVPLVEENRDWQVILADEGLEADDYLLRHKTTARSHYDRSLAELPEGVFDAIFFNTQGEVCEGARSNIFVERGGRLLTPPVQCGLLPGVMRRHLLESGRAVEEVLTRGDLLGASRLYVANALRGLMPVKLKG